MFTSRYIITIRIFYHYRYHFTTLTPRVHYTVYYCITAFISAHYCILYSEITITEAFITTYTAIIITLFIISRLHYHYYYYVCLFTLFRLAFLHFE